MVRFRDTNYTHHHMPLPLAYSYSYCYCTETCKIFLFFCSMRYKHCFLNGIVIGPSPERPMPEYHQSHQLLTDLMYGTVYTCCFSDCQLPVCFGLKLVSCKAKSFFMLSPQTTHILILDIIKKNTKKEKVNFAQLCTSKHEGKGLHIISPVIFTTLRPCNSEMIESELILALMLLFE